MTNKHQKRRQQWMAQLEDEIVKLDPSRAGRINWDEALFHFSRSNDQRPTPAEAAARIVAASRVTPRQFVVRETVRLVTYVEADSPEQAIDIVNGQGVSEFDEIEQLPMGSQTITVEEVNEGGR